MRKGAFVLIFLVWSFITFITPTLVQWSVAAQAQADDHDEAIVQSIQDNPSDEGKVKPYRRMLVLLTNGINMRKVLPEDELALPPDSIVPLPAPSPVQESDQEAERWPVELVTNDQAVY